MRSRSKLRPRELQVIRLLCQGKFAKQIAAELGISQSTVQGHMKRMRENHGAAFAAHLVSILYLEGTLP